MYRRENAGVVIIKLGELLEKNNMTQKELSLRTHIRPGTISALVNNTWKTISETVISRICQVFNCRPGDFIEYVADPSESIPEKTDLARAKDIYYEHLGTRPENLEHISLTVAEYGMLQRILKNAQSSEDNPQMVINLEWLLNRLTALTVMQGDFNTTNKAANKPTILTIWLSNDHYLDDFTHILYHIVKEHKREVIYDFSDANEDSIFEGLYIKFIEKTDNDTLKKIENLVKKNMIEKYTEFINNKED